MEIILDLKEIFETSSYMIRILVTSIGATGAQNVIKSLRKQTAYPVMIFGCDALIHNPGVHMVDEFSLVPNGLTPEFSRTLSQICIDNKIDILIPIMEAELECVSGSPDVFLKFHPVVSSSETIKICNDKARTQVELQKTGILFPEQYHSQAEAQFPVIIKPRTGTGGVGIQIIRKPEEWPATLDLSKVIIQQFIEGMEYTVDCYRSGNRNFIASVPRKRLAVKGGLATKSLTVEHPELCRISETILKHLDIIGPANIQFIETIKGELFFIEINPRFGGAYIASIEAGLNSPLFIMNEFMGDPIAYSGYQRNLLMMRFWEETYEKNAVV